jgi:hypothetical protein
MILGAGFVLVAVGMADQFDGVPTCTGYVSDPPTPGHPNECESGGPPSVVFWLPGLVAIVAATASSLRRR